MTAPADEGDMATLADAWAELHAVIPPGWYVRPTRDSVLADYDVGRPAVRWIALGVEG